MSFRRRTFPEVIDNILTSVTGGVAAESHPFPPAGGTRPPFQHSLQQPEVGAIVSVYGSRNGEPHLFRQDVDYALLSDGHTFQWNEGAELPDSGSLLQVNYNPKSAAPQLTDIHTGSVVRTLAESVGLEIARLYAQLDAVYQAGFIDTATGSSLDNVVALLGIQRIRGGKPAGQIEFRRVSGSRGSIHVPAGTRIITKTGDIEYETTESITMNSGQNTLSAVARDLEVNDPLTADMLTILARPISGIEAVTNPKPTTITTEDETDRALRIRAKNFLHGSERATLGAITNAIARQGINAEVTEDMDKPGFIYVTPLEENLSPDQYQRLRQAIKDTRPAGVCVELTESEPPRKVNLEMRITTIAGLLEQDLRTVQRGIRQKVEGYFKKLPTASGGSVNRIVGLALGFEEVDDVRLLSATWDEDGVVHDVLDRENGQLNIQDVPKVLGDLQIADPNLPTQLTVTVTFPDSENRPNSDKITADLSTMMTYLNNVNASETTEEAIQTLSYGKLLHVMTLPNNPGKLLEDFDEAVTNGGNIPELPTARPPYAVTFIFTLESGLSRILSQPADSYLLTGFERLALGGVEIHAEPNDA